MTTGDTSKVPPSYPRIDVRSLAGSLRAVAAAARVLMLVAPVLSFFGFVMVLFDPFGEHGSMHIQWRDVPYYSLLALQILSTSVGLYFYFGFIRFFAVYFGTVIEKRYL